MASVAAVIEKGREREETVRRGQGRLYDLVGLRGDLGFSPVR